MTSVLRRAKIATVSVAYLFAIATGFLNPVLVRADATVAYSGTDVTGMTEDVIALPGITVGGTDPVISLELSINDGVLRMTNTTGISFYGSQTGSRINFYGSVADMNTALATLEYRSITPGQKTLVGYIYTDGVVFNPSNGHMYEVIDSGGGISWQDANTLASGRTLLGASGYLATVTTQAENDYLLGRLTSDGWFGASDAGTEGQWQWVTGPEAGTTFWSGQGNGSPVGGRFSNWANGEPNDASDEDCAQFYASGSGWNDLDCVEDNLDYYIVEYGADGNMPTAPDGIEFDVTVNQPTGSVTTITSCLDLIAVNGDDQDRRYNTLSLTGNIDCTGETINPLFPENDTDFGNIGFRGEFDGNGYTISNIAINEDGTHTVGLFSSLRGANVHDLTLEGDVHGDNCTGGLAGRVNDATITNVTIDMQILGQESTGGMIGCVVSNGSQSVSITNSTSSAVVDADDNSPAGGVIGNVALNDDATFSISDTTFDGDVTEADSSIGGIVGGYRGYNNSTGSFSDLTTKDVSHTGAYQVGGMAGSVFVENSASVSISEVEFTGSEVEGTETVGGIIGIAGNYTGDVDNFTVSDIHISANITANSGYYSGGIIGDGERISIEDVSYNGAINGSDGTNGGLVGTLQRGVITRSSSSGTATATSGAYVGGLVGYSYEIEINQSYSTMDVSVPSQYYLGGLVGYLESSEISDSYARGDVSGDEDVGGLIGYCYDSTISRSYSTGAVSANSDEGGFTGDDSSCSTNDSFWDMDTSGIATTEGDATGKSTINMKKSSTFTNTATVGLDSPWDFNTVWQRVASINDGYPCLRWTNVACTGEADSDGIPSNVESAAPNSGDANNDGTADNTQTHVASFVNPVTSQYTVVETDAACSLAEVAAEAEASKAVVDSGYNYTSGLVNFTAECGTPGYTTTVRVIVYGATSSGLVLRKHNPNTNAYFTVSGATLTDVVIGGVPAVQVTYQIVDGGQLDIDGVTNGTIVDPVGLATLAVGAPNTGFSR